MPAAVQSRIRLCSTRAFAVRLSEMPSQTASRMRLCSIVTSRLSRSVRIQALRQAVTATWRMRTWWPRRTTMALLVR